MLLYILDLISVFAFAFFGANAGIKQRFTFLGIMVCAFLPALGGGTIRELLLNHTPSYASDYTYGAIVLLAVLFALGTRRFTVLASYMSVLDALGMAVFAYLGAKAALLAGLGLGGSVIFALLTACGGGILCDLLTRQQPHAFRQRLYTLPPILLGVIFWAMSGNTTPQYMVILIIGVAFMVQLAISYQKLPKLHFTPLLKLARNRAKSVELSAE